MIQIIFHRWSIQFLTFLFIFCVTFGLGTKINIGKYLGVQVDLGSMAFAGDDLLDILGSKDTQSIVKDTNVLAREVKQELKNVTAEQNIFLGFLASEKWEKAFYQWFSAFKGTQYANSPNGKALFSFLLIKNGLPTMAVNELFTIQKLTDISTEMKRLLTQELPENHPVWSMGGIKWNDSWTTVFGEGIKIKVLSYQAYNPKILDESMSLLKNSKAETHERYWLEWQVALGLALQGDVAKSAKVLAHLLKENQNVISKDLISLTAARLLYQQGYLSAAVRYYTQVSKSSDYWFVAQEEMAWAYLRKGEPQNTIAVMKSLMIPEFGPHVGAEALVLNALAQLKVCNYPEVAKTIKEFRIRFKERAKKLIEITQKGKTPAVAVLLSHLEKDLRKTHLLDLKTAANEVPRYVTRDEALMSAVANYKLLKAESHKAESLYSNSLTEGTAKVGFQGDIELFKKEVQKKYQESYNLALNIIKKRAQEEVEEIRNQLLKMHIIEAELIEQVSAAERVMSASSGKSEGIDKSKGKFLDKNGSLKSSSEKKSSSEFAKGEYDLSFPYKGELWFDEISNYKVDVTKACRAKKAM